MDFLGMMMQCKWGLLGLMWALQKAWFSKSKVSAPSSYPKAWGKWNNLRFAMMIGLQVRNVVSFSYYPQYFFHHTRRFTFTISISWNIWTVVIPPTITVVICNTFPSNENKLMGRFLDPEKSAPPSWCKESHKLLSDMYQRLLTGYGVKKEDFDNYRRDATKSNKLRHGELLAKSGSCNSIWLISKSTLSFLYFKAHLKGVIDPTGKLPPNKVFITGYVSGGGNKRELFGKVHKKVFVSRAPALEPGDAKLLSVVGTKPKGMSSDDWSMLSGYGFGMIIFPKSGTKSTPLPCVIAGMYCLCVFNVVTPSCTTII